MGTGVTNPLRSSSFGGNEDFKQAEGACRGLLGKPVDETVSFIIMMYSFLCAISPISPISGLFGDRYGEVSMS